jgi:osmoprotectant transport system ATP-binding protein
MIEFRHATKNYGNVVALHDFSATIPSRTITVLMGLSGSGKTTAIRMVNKMVLPTGGQVLIDGEDVATRDAVQLRRSIGYVMQDVGLLPHKTVLQNVVLIAVIAGQTRNDAERNARAMLSLVGIDPASFDRFPSQLSGGQQQRVGVARALATKPNILLMDEPFGAVDPIVREELQVELCRIQRELGLTILFVTHDRHEALTIADQLIVMSNAGTIEQSGTPEELTSTPANDFVRKILGL